MNFVRGDGGQIANICFAGTMRPAALCNELNSESLREATGSN
jgi:hypothetical protein